MAMDVAISGGILLSAENGYQPYIGSLGLEDGRIVKVAHGSIARAEAKEWIDASGKIILPGLVNAHCHGDMTVARGLGDGMTLLEQIEAFAGHNWFSAFLDDEDRFVSRQLTYAEALLSGTTFLCENMYWSLKECSIEAMAQSGISGALCEDIRADFSRPDEFVSDDWLIRFRDLCRKNGLVPVIGSISEEDFSPETLLRIRQKANELGMPETRHLAENDWRVRLVQQRFGKTPVRFLSDEGVLTRGMIGSHGVYIGEDEAALLAEAVVSIANTPLCEMKICDGVAPIPTYLKHGVNVCLGSDGAMWNNTNDIFAEMKGMLLLHSLHGSPRALSARDVLNMATVNGYRAFGIPDAGTLAKGMRANITLLDATGAHMAPLRLGVYENVTSAVVFCATGRDVTDVFVEGRRVVNQRQLTTLNVQDLIQKLETASQKIVTGLEHMA